MLEGAKVLSFTHYMQGPSAAQVLADLGAEVVKVESVKGAYERSWSGCNTYPGGVSMFFLLANRNQTAISVNLKSAEGKPVSYTHLDVYKRQSPQCTPHRLPAAPSWTGRAGSPAGKSPPSSR